MTIKEKAAECIRLIKVLEERKDELHLDIILAGLKGATEK